MNVMPVATIHASIHRHERVGYAVLLLLFVAMGGWAATTDISGAVIAPGVLVVDTSVKKVQHPSGGVVGEVRVRDGDRVTAGDILVRLDETITRANLGIVSKELVELTVRKARLEAERDGSGQMQIPTSLLERAQETDVAQTIDGERKLFEMRVKARWGQKAQLKERIAQLNEETTSLQAQVGAKSKELSLIERELAAASELWEKNLVPLAKLSALQRESVRLEGERGQLLSAMAQTKGKVSEIELQIAQIDRDLSSEVGKDLRETESKLGELAERRVAAEDQLKRTDIRAPQTGTVHQSTVHTVGGVVPAGEAIMLIVPDSDFLVVEAKVQPHDIDQLLLGQKVIVRFSSFSQRTTPEVSGEITRISPDITTDQRSGQSTYLVRIATSKDEIGRLGAVKLVPGMPVDAFIQTADRNILSYLLKPLHDQIIRAFREN